jgi:hypothetical protein
MIHGLNLTTNVFLKCHVLITDSSITTNLSVENSLSPAWTTQFQAEYIFGVETRINVGVFDEVQKTGKHRPMGSAVFELGEILGARGNVKAKKMKDGGTIYCSVTAATDDCYGTFHLQLRGLDIGKGGVFKGKPDPFFVLNSQATQGGTSRVWHPVYRSEVQTQSNLAEWKALDIPIEKICGGDLNQPIQVEVYDYEKSGKHKLLGRFQTTVNGIMGAQQCKQELGLVSQGKLSGQILVLEATATGGDMQAGAATKQQPAMVLPTLPQLSVSMPPKLEAVSPPARLSASMPPQASKPVSPSASGGGMIPSVSQYPICISSLPPPLPPPAFVISDGPSYDPASVVPIPPPTSQPSTTLPSTNRVPKFIDYLSGGLEINLTVAIDFTGSNGDPRKPGTLHHLAPDKQQLNDYEKALTAVGSIVARYDSDQRFPVLGFGAKYKNLIQHCFQVGSTTESIGIHGVLQSYRSVFSTGLTMSGPTVFADVIRHAANKAKRKWDQYSVIGKQSYEILLIVTDGAVTNMDETRLAIKEASVAPLSIIVVGVGNEDFSSMRSLDNAHEGNSDMRDIVQFVEFSRHRNDRQALTRETLLEIPDQVVDYFYKHKSVMPLPALTGSKVDVVEEEYNADCDLDLSMSVGEDGSIRLVDTQRATWDATSYGTAAAFLPPAIRPPPFNPSISNNSGGSTEHVSTAYIPAHSGHGPLSYSISPQVSPGGHSMNGSSNHTSTAASGSSGVYVPSRSGKPTNSSCSATLPVSPGPHTVYAPLSSTQSVQVSRSATLTPYATPPVSPTRLTPYVVSKSPVRVPGLPLLRSNGSKGGKS